MYALTTGTSVQVYTLSFGTPDPFEMFYDIHYTKVTNEAGLPFFHFFYCSTKASFAQKWIDLLLKTVQGTNNERFFLSYLTSSVSVSATKRGGDWF